MRAPKTAVWSPGRGVLCLAADRAILAVVQRWTAEHGEGPSVRQIADTVGTKNTASVACHLENLENLEGERGALVR
ncbi:hypothetical protein JHN63_38715 [Streptomyces sp. MBT65]|uniref:LexA family protein n=1 Tax=Streptomyces sp. MBT65 TaxID=1488395 RepID=UPI00190A7887|nr:hypothetical protein [Streptomyces sp. MBT65]MBK3579629.1 hypothetical protein [Streptomyces sp. MBT65]